MAAPYPIPPPAATVEYPTARFMAASKSIDKAKAILTIRAALSGVKVRYLNDKTDTGIYARSRVEQAEKYLDMLEGI